MSMQTRWVGRESSDVIADVRMRCYGSSPAERANFAKYTEYSGFTDGNVLLCEDEGTVVGTATNLSLEMTIRGGRVPCQGVAWVGTVRSHRRRRVGGQGVASTIMSKIIGRARERGDVVTALMPFRSSFYEHFGYGTVERQNEWTVPLSILPPGETDGFRDYRPDDLTAMEACRVRQALAGQCDVLSGQSGLATWQKIWDEAGFTFVDQPSPGGPIHSFITVQLVLEDDEAIALVEEPCYDSPAALNRLLSFLGNLRDQYLLARISLPVDVPLNWLLKERQVAHRRVHHPSAVCKTINRMQLRVIDHRRLIEAMKLAPGQTGKVVVAVQESEGGESRFAIDFATDRAVVTPSQATPDVMLKDSTWAGVVTGALPARDAVAYGLADCQRQSCTALLDRFAVGPAAFCWDYF